MEKQKDEGKMVREKKDSKQEDNNCLKKKKSK